MDTPSLEKIVVAALEDITQWLDHHRAKAIVDVFDGATQAWG